jgi:hypothetical protein
MCGALVVGGAVLAATSCERSKPARERALTFEELERLQDTTGLTRGAALLRSFEPYRLPNQLIRVRGEMNVPDGTRLQVSIYVPETTELLSRVQFEIRDHRFHSPPLLGPAGPLPAGRYEFELMTIFDSAWQPPAVLRATDDGKRLRGPGITRGRSGIAAYLHQEEFHL